MAWTMNSIESLVAFLAVAVAGIALALAAYGPERVALRASSRRRGVVED